MKHHPIADVWPMMNDNEISHLAQDIKKHGLLNPIWLYEGQILDGRNRHKACEIAGIAVKVNYYTGDNPVQFAFSQNEERRHLNSGQRAALAAELRPQLEIEAKKRQGKRNDLEPNIREKIPECRSNDQAAKITGTNAKYVDHATKIKDAAPDIFDKLKAGKITMQDAKREVSRRPTTDEWLPDERQRQKENEKGTTVLANYERDKHLILWAEKAGKLVAIDRLSKWGNPFILNKDGNRNEVCQCYERYYLPHKKSLLNAINELKGKVLCCHCYPEKCHGESLIGLLNG